VYFVIYWEHEEFLSLLMIEMATTLRMSTTGESWLSRTYCCVEKRDYSLDC